MLFDTHCHLDFERFDEDRDEVVARAAAAGVTRIVVPALDLENAPVVLDLADRYEAVYAAVGVHPNSSAGWEDGWIDRLRELAEHEKVVAIGEIGLDYYWDRSAKETQQRALAKQLALATELDLPVIIHNRESDADVLRLLAQSPLRGKERPGVLHSFLTTWETAEAALEMGYYLGFTGPLTYPKNDELRAVVERVPLDRLLIETDAPFLSPQAHRGKRNEPAFVQLIATQMAEILGLKEATIAAMTTDNAACLFGRHLLR
ncbi:MAG: TatD family hydrolase [Candidatus Promineifilaceae bacterium]|nr:TatD family hydrolase [Candidatus Promineifilaceae bacterium]